MLRPTTVFALTVLSLICTLVGCKHKPGDKCQGDSATCTDRATALACTDSVLTVVPCRGPKGCAKSGLAVQCDDSKATAGDACLQHGTIACAVDAKAALECKSGKFTVIETCKGSKGCSIKENEISCDNNVADLGDPCHRDGDYACAVDKMSAFKCENKKFELVNTCRGKKGCRVMELPEENQVEFSCDDSFSLENDACHTPGDHACSVDRKAILICKASKYVVDKACAGGCSFDESDRSLSCADARGAKSAVTKADQATKTGKGGTAGAPAATKPAASAAPVVASAAASAKTGATAKPAAPAVKPAKKK
jgi:hypothetical protein